MKLNKYSREVFGGKGGLSRFFSSLDHDIQELHRRVDQSLRYKSSIQTVLIKMTGTKVHHGLNRIPVAVRVLPKGNAQVWETERTTTSVTLKSSADVSAEVEVKG